MRDRALTAVPRSARRRAAWALAGAALVVSLAAACASDAEAPTPGATSAAEPAVTTDTGPARSFALGFTHFPHAVSTDALLDAYEVIGRDGDLVAQHFDGGVPWPEALAGARFAEDFERELEGTARVQPEGHRVYLAVTPIAFERDGLAAYRGDQANQPLPAPWGGRDFDHPEVIDAYVAYVERLIALYEPDWVAYAIEANMLADLAPERFPAFLRLAEAVYGRLRAAHPALPLLVTLQAEWFHTAPVAQAEAIGELLRYSDLVAVSSYPFARPALLTDAASASGAADEAEALVASIPAGYFAEIAALAPDKPFAITESGWPAEPIGEPYPIAIAGSPNAQRAYVERLLREAEALDAAFVTWFFTRDFDEQWLQQLADSPLAPTVRLWRDNGLYAGDGAPRPALDAWRQALARERAARP
jgi:hypothetical protein